LRRERERVRVSVWEEWRWRVVKRRVRRRRRVVVEERVLEVKGWEDKITTTLKHIYTVYTIFVNKLIYLILNIRWIYYGLSPSYYYCLHRNSDRGYNLESFFRISWFNDHFGICLVNNVMFVEMRRF